MAKQEKKEQKKPLKTPWHLRIQKHAKKIIASAILIILVIASATAWRIHNLQPSVTLTYNADQQQLKVNVEEEIVELRYAVLAHPLDCQSLPRSDYDTRVIDRLIEVKNYNKKYICVQATTKAGDPLYSRPLLIKHAT